MHVSYWVQFTVEEARFDIIIFTRKKTRVLQVIKTKQMSSSFINVQWKCKHE